MNFRLHYQKNSYNRKENMTKKTYTYHNNSRVARYFAEKRGGKYIGFMGDLELQLEIIKDNNRDKDIRTSKKGAYVVEYDK